MVSVSRFGNWIWACAGLVVFSTPFTVLAATSIQFSKAQLESFTALVRPELTTIRIDGRSGEFHPAPSLEFAGFEPQVFDINLNLGASLVDLRFHEIRANAPTLAFEDKQVRIEVSLKDQDKAIRSMLGAIHFRGVKIVAWLNISSENGIQVSFERGEVQGELKGTGLLKPRWVTDAIQNIFVKSMKTEIEKMLGRATLQASIEKGFVTWAQFSSDRKLSRVLPRSVVVSGYGITFEAD